MQSDRLRRNTIPAIGGFLASLAMYLLIYVGIHILQSAPFNIPPSAAFLYNLGIESKGLALLLHFSYGILWAYVLKFAYENEVTIYKALMLAVILWIFMMLVYSPLIGWGIFGFGYAYQLSANHPLYLTGGIHYMVATLILHLVYGIVVGYITSRW